MTHPFKDIITRLEKQRASIERALTALREVGEIDDTGREALSIAPTKAKRKGKRKVSAEARARMAEGQRLRWAAKRANEAGKATRKGAVKKADAA